MFLTEFRLLALRSGRQPQLKTEKGVLKKRACLFNTLREIYRDDEK